MFTPTSAFPTMTGFIVDSMSKRDCAVGVGMFVTQMMIVENRTTVIARIRIVPMTSDTPDSSSRRITRSEEHTSELQSQSNLVCRLLLEKKNKSYYTPHYVYYI